MKFVHSLIALALPLAALADSIACSENNNCPEDAPCCSQYGVCGTGAYCLGACDPRFSYNISACVPLPVCQSKDVTFASTSNIISQTKYLGDPSQADFVTSGDVLSYNDNVLLTMANGSYGTVLSSTRAMWYGKVSATMKTSRTQGVVSAFILMSPVKDEIDYEFIGSYLESGQTNYYWRGALDYTQSRNISLSDTFENYHTYSIDWTEDSITWSIDGQAARVLNKADTLNTTTGLYQFPQTPSIVQISIWPGGSNANGQGTIDWAGGDIDWNAADIQDPGYFYVTLKDVSITCYDAPSNVSSTGDVSYKYIDNQGLASSIQLSGDGTVLGSFEAVGYDMNKGSDGSLDSVSGSVPSGVAAGSNGNRGDGSSDSNASIADASVISISATKASSTSSASIADATGSASKPKVSSTSSESLADATGSASKTSSTSSASSSASASSSSGASSSSESAASSAASSSTAAATSDSGSFDQGGSTGGSTTTTAATSAASANGSSSKLDMLTSSFLGLVGFVVIAMITV